MSEKKDNDFLEQAVADATTINKMAMDSAKVYLSEVFSDHIKEELKKKLMEEDSKLNSLQEQDEEKEEKEEEKESEKEAKKKDEEKEDDEEKKEEDVEIDIDKLIAEMESEIDDEKKELEQENDETLEIDLDGLTEEKEKEEDTIFEVDLKELENELGLVVEQEEKEKEDDDEEKEDDDEEKKEEKKEKKESVDAEIARLKKENAKYVEAIETMQEKLNEAIFLNTKLKYANLLTSSKALTEDQKQKIINAFDRAETVKEVKLAFATLVEAFDLESVETDKKSNRVKIKEGASKIQKPTLVDTDEEVLSEQKYVKGYKRLQKLAGISEE